MANLWQNITGTVKTAFKIGRTNTATLDASGLTASRAQALPDKAGTLVVQLASGKIDGVTNGTATGEALTFDAIGVSVHAYDADLAAVAGLSSSGLIARTGAGTAAARTITGTTNQVTVSNGDGVSGNPTLSLPQSIDTAATFRVGSLGVGMAPTYLVDILSPTLTDFDTKWVVRARGPSNCTANGSNFMLALDMSVTDMSVSAGVTDAGYRVGVRGDSFAGTAGFAGTLATQYGVLGRAGISSATAGAVVTNAYALSAEMLNSVAGTTITNGIGLRVVNAATTGTMTNRWGVYVDTATGGKNYFSHAVGVGSTTISAQVHATSTTEQLRLGYDSSNYLSTTVSSGGEVTFDAVGASAGFVFSDNVGIGVTPIAKLHLGLTASTPGNLALSALDFVGMEYSGGSLILGYNCKAFESTTEKVVVASTNATVGYDFIRLGYNNGIEFHTLLGSVTAAATASSPRMVIKTDGNVIIGHTGTALGKLESRATSGAQLVASYDSSNYLSTTVSSAGAVTFDSVGSGAAFSFSDSVAIGVATPLYPLHVNLSSGDNQLYVSSGTPSSVSGDSYLTLGSSRADTGVGHICKIRSVAVSAGKADLAFLTQPSNGVYTERMRVDNAGNVGIGTTSPRSKLQVTATETVASAGVVQIGGGASAAYGVLVDYAALNSGRCSITQLNNSGGSAATIALGFGAISSGFPTNTVVTLTQAANVGVGTTSPSARVHAISTTEQLRLGYDASNYYSTTVSSAGAVTFDSVGASSSFTFSDAVTVSTATPLVTFQPTVNTQDCGLKILNAAGSAAGYLSIIPNTIGTSSKFFLYVGGNTAADIKLTVDDDGVANINRDASNYVTITPSAVGLITFDAVGSGAAFSFSDNVGIGISVAPTALCHTGASTTARASLCLPHGTAPSSPVNGDMWTTTAGLFTRINGVTNSVGDVVGPASSVTGAASVFSGTTGKLLRASPTVTYYSVSAGAEDKVEFGATFKDFRTATDGATVTFDLDLSDQWQVTFAGNRTMAVSNASIGQVITILRYQDATGNRTPTWWANIAWDNGLAPVDDPTASGWSMTVLACVGLDAYSVPNWKEVCRSTSAPRLGITTATYGATTTFDLRVSPRQTVTLAGNSTLALTSGSLYVGMEFRLKLTQDGTGSRTVTWFSAIKWPGGTVPTLTTTAGRSDWFRFECTNASGSPTFDCVGTSMNLAP